MIELLGSVAAILFIALLLSPFILIIYMLTKL
jgi:hypothetical protein